MMVAAHQGVEIKDTRRRGNAGSGSRCGDDAPTRTAKAERNLPPTRRPS